MLKKMKVLIYKGIYWVVYAVNWIIGFIGGWFCALKIVLAEKMRHEHLTQEERIRRLYESMGYEGIVTEEMEQEMDQYRRNSRKLLFSELEEDL